MQYRIVEKDEFRVVGRKARVPMVHQGVNPAIAAHIQAIGPETAQRIAGLSDQEPDGILSAIVHFSDSREEGVEFDYWHAAVTSSAVVPDDLDVLTVPAGTWAVFENTGPYPEALQLLWRDVATQWFPSNPYQSRPGPEILRTRPSQDWTESHSQLWIPVERAPLSGGGAAAP